MSKEKYGKILMHLHTLNDDKEKVTYLDSVIEPVDNDYNGFNDELIALRNRLNQRGLL